MRLLAIGKAGRNTPETELFLRYAARLRPPLELMEISPAQGAPAEIKRRESEMFAAALSPQDFVIALDQDGEAPDSAGLARMLAGWLERSRKLSFIIGGAEGLDATILARANARLSLGNLTWPHLLVRPMLAEQLYRAQSIASGHPYHRTGRP
jgi:23S rRNA (pseudouridine1915-N3)-methyltransferase